MQIFTTFKKKWQIFGCSQAAAGFYTMNWQLGIVIAEL